MSIKANFFILVFATAFTTALSDIDRDVGELEYWVSDLRDKQNASSIDILKVKDELKNVLSEIKLMKIAIQSTADQQQKAMYKWALRTDKLMKATNEERECFKYDDNAASCLQKPFCSFCVKDDFSSIRCDTPENLISSGCPQSSLVNSSKSPEIIVVPNDGTASKLPLEYTIPLCPGTKRDITITFQTANLPVDVYLLTDMYSVHHLKRTPGLLKHLAETVKTLSPDFKLGLGISLDKSQSPFGDDESFSFQNVFPLSTDVEQFSDSLKSHVDPDSGDAPDGQLEGMFQAAACKRQIGWRSNSRKILLAPVGYPYHVHGDGAEGGISKPFDGLCALNETGFYANELTQDYPSEDQLIQIVKQENINVVFAVDTSYDNTMIEKYTRLADRMNPSAYLFVSQSAYSDLSTEFTKVMNEMNSVVDLEQSQTSDDIKVVLYSNCNGEEEERTNKCKNIVNGTSTFNVEFEMLHCPGIDDNRNQVLKINPKGLPISAEILIRLFCNCTF